MTGAYARTPGARAIPGGFFPVFCDSMRDPWML